LVRGLIVALLLGRLVTRASAQDSAITLLPADPLHTRLDPNGFLLNPQWFNSPRLPNIDSLCRFRVHTEELERRTLWVTREKCLSATERSTVSLNEPPGTLGIGFECATASVTGKVRGHVNWFPVTVTGSLEWVGFSAGPEDHDFTFDLTPSDTNALTAGNPPDSSGRPAYHVEFYREETLARLPSGQSWWHSLDATAAMKQKLGNAAAARLMNGRLAIVSGLYGLDGVHNFQAEIHPLYAMAVLIDATRSEGGLAERWALMVRDRGSEGDCGQGDLPMITSRDSVQHFVFDLGSVAGFDSTRVASDQLWATDRNSAIKAATLGGDRLYVDIPHRRPIQGSPDFLIVGEIRVNLIGAGTRFYSSHLGDLVTLKPGIKIGGYENLPRLNADTALHGVRGPFATQIFQQYLVDYPRLQPLPPRAVESIEAEWRPARSVVVYRVPQWIRQIAPLLVDCAGGASGLRKERLCTRKVEWGLVPLGITAQGQYAPAAFLFLHAHSWTSSFLGDVINSILGGFSYRFELRAEDFANARESKRMYRGGALRVAAMLGPNTRRVSESLTVAPYLLASPGVAVLHAQTRTHAVATYGTGAGLLLLGSGLDAFFEITRYTAWHSEGQHRYSVGLMWPIL
jgi:hypothetical protein